MQKFFVSQSPPTLGILQFRRPKKTAPKNNRPKNRRLKNQRDPLKIDLTRGLLWFSKGPPFGFMDACF